VREIEDWPTVGKSLLATIGVAVSEWCGARHDEARATVIASPFAVI
jgi:hypothetical protein